MTQILILPVSMDNLRTTLYMVEVQLILFRMNEPESELTYSLNKTRNLLKKKIFLIEFEEALFSALLVIENDRPMGNIIEWIDIISSDDEEWFRIFQDNVVPMMSNFKYASYDKEIDAAQEFVSFVKHEVNEAIFERRY